MRGATSNDRPYRNSHPVWFEKSLPASQRRAYVITAFWRELVRVVPSPLVNTQADIRLGER